MSEWLVRNRQYRRLRLVPAPAPGGPTARLATIRRAESLFHIVEAHLPVVVSGDGDFDEWPIVAPALVSIATGLAEGVWSSPPPRGRIRAEALARSLADYAITFAWLAGTADEGERESRIKSFERAEFMDREKTDRKWSEHIAGKQLYHDRPGAPLGEQLIESEVTRRRIAELKADKWIPPRMGALDTALKADEYWMAKEPWIERVPFALLYSMMFDTGSSALHPSITAIGRIVTGAPGKLLVGRTEIMGEADGPYGMALIALAHMLFVSSHVLGWPKRDVVSAAFQRG